MIGDCTNRVSKFYLNNIKNLCMKHSNNMCGAFIILTCVLHISIENHLIMLTSSLILLCAHCYTDIIVTGLLEVFLVTLKTVCA